MSLEPETISRPKNGTNKKHPFVKAKRRSRYFYLKILRIDDPPEVIARGAAIGVFMGVFPTFGVGTFLSLGAAFLLKANKASAVIGSFIVNPITGPFFWTLSMLTGAFIMREDYTSLVDNIKTKGILSGGGWATEVFMVGNIIITLIFTFASYYAVKALVIRHRRKKEEKRLKKLAGL